jgi:transcriptional regulator NrdR family protein
MDSREAKEGIRRRRKCQSCGARFSTHESVVAGETKDAGRDDLARRLEGRVGEIEQAAREMRLVLAELGAWSPTLKRVPRASQGLPQPSQETFEL